ncbi:hypothetical protein E4L96_20060 [Massilia arenosa]|uniref:Uncharacterized protein n=1 Tax=Zemynaea arenosa TaxID=2561931 RepID=A0A4Y9RWX2_9BURK|nr:hypothetical protein [Massilia arenosa]TFW13393.1 hypothetical protein E4L96_20060 [Massilia arenosa]
MLAALALVSALSAPGPRMQVDDLRPLLRTALLAPNGTAHGQLAGPIAGAFGARFKTNNPVLIDVTTEFRYASPGCARLRIEVEQRAVTLYPEESPRDMKLQSTLNYCLDGGPPRTLERRREP